MKSTQTIKITSIQAPNQDFIIAGVAEYLGARLGKEVRFVGELPWQERERLLDAGQIDIGWVCGLPYIRKVERYPQQWELLAAPVMRGARYEKRPIYFSDVVVHQASPYQSFTDLRGARWAYNEPNSHSGYNVMRYYLAQEGLDGNFFGRVIEAGSHEEALNMILSGTVDAAAIDSTVLELALFKKPGLANDLRIVNILGPSPIPPLLISRRIPSALRPQIRELLLAMHRDPLGRTILERGLIDRYVSIDDADYDLVRKMTRIGEAVKLQRT